MTRSARRLATAATVLAATLGLSVSCAPPPPEDAPIVEEEVSVHPDANIDPTRDETATYASGVTQLPADFPDVPLPRGTAVIDQTVDGPRATLVLLVPESLPAFRVSFADRLREAGWKGPAALDERSATTYTKGDARIAVEAKVDGPSSRVWIEY